MIDPVATATPATELQAVGYLTTALTTSMLQVPPQNVALYFLALVWIETARGKSIIRNNPGSLIAKGFSGGQEKSYWSGEFWRPDWWFDGSKNDGMFAGTVPSAFRAYATPEQGWTDFASLVTRKQSLLSAAMADDPLAFVRALRATGYSQDYTDNVASSFRSLVDGFRAKGYFAPFSDVKLPSPAVASNSPKASSSGSGGMWAAAAIAVFALGLLYATTRIKPGSRRRLAAA